MHLLRQPSTLPPPFSADIAPPPLMTPPPGYDYTPGQQQQALDYFTQLTVDDNAEVERASDDSEIGTRTPGLHPALGLGSSLGVPGQGLHDARGRRGSAIELSSSSRFGDAAASFYSRDASHALPRSVAGNTMVVNGLMQAPPPALNFGNRPNVNGIMGTSMANRTNSNMNGVSGGLRTVHGATSAPLARQSGA